MEKRKLPRCEDANAPQTKKPCGRTREGGRLGVAGDLGPEAQEATRHLGWYLVRGCLRRAARSLRDKPALGGIRRGEALPLQRERH